MAKNRTWEPGSLPPNTRPLPSVVILRVRRDASGRPVRFKESLVARGNLKDQSTNHTELYAPVAFIDLVKDSLSIAVAKNWDIGQVDMVGAFLQATVPKSNPIWIRIPNIPDIDEGDGILLRLVKSLYGIQKALKLW